MDEKWTKDLERVSRQDPDIEPVSFRDRRLRCSAELAVLLALTADQTAHSQVWRSIHDDAGSDPDPGERSGISR
jgi:hypothetical protein